MSECCGQSDSLRGRAFFPFEDAETRRRELLPAPSDPTAQASAKAGGYDWRGARPVPEAVDGRTRVRTSSKRVEIVEARWEAPLKPK